MTFENITVEGMTNCAIRVFALSSTENIHVKNLKIGAWNQLDPSSQVNLLKRYSNSAGQKVTLGNETRDSRGLKLENYTVGGTVIQKSGNNWAADQLGRIGLTPRPGTTGTPGAPAATTPTPTRSPAARSSTVRRTSASTAPAAPLSTAPPSSSGPAPTRPR
ncbi:family 49 glycosyl hydrolase [Streptomyces thinghirensis]|nr:family 49 glycosyl hydrolase [Streptomyces thinghirensis]